MSSYLSREISAVSNGSNISVGHSEMQFEKFIGLIRRKFWFIIVCGLSALCVAAFGANFIKPDYTAKAQLIIQSDLFSQSPIADVKEVQLAVDTQMTILASRDFLQSFIDNSEILTNRSVPTDSENHQGKSDYLNIFRKIFGYRTNSVLEDKSKLDRFIKNYDVRQELTSPVISIRYTSKDPEIAAKTVNDIVKKFLDIETEKRSQQFEAEKRRLREKISDLENNIQQIQLKIPQLQIKIAETPNQTSKIENQVISLKNLAEFNADLIDKLKERLKQIQHTKETTNVGIEILSSAHPPQKPSSLNVNLFILPAGILGILFGTFLVLLIENFDISIKSDRDVVEKIGIDCLGYFPKFRNIFSTIPFPNEPTNSKDKFSTSIDYISTKLFYHSKDNQSQIFLVTACETQKSQSIFSAYLAHRCQINQGEVLLIDFNIPSKNFLEKLIDKGVEIENDELPIFQSNLGFGYINLARSEFVNNFNIEKTEWKSSIEDLRKKYNIIIINSTPIYDIDLIPLLSESSDEVIFLFKWGKTNFPIAKQAIQLLNTFKQNRENSSDNISSVITDVPLKRHLKYRFGDSAEWLMRHRKKSYSYFKVVV